MVCRAVPCCAVSCCALVVLSSLCRARAAVVVAATPHGVLCLVAAALSRRRFESPPLRLAAAPTRRRSDSPPLRLAVASSRSLSASSLCRARAALVVAATPHGALCLVAAALTFAWRACCAVSCCAVLSSSSPLSVEHGKAHGGRSVLSVGARRAAGDGRRAVGGALKAAGPSRRAAHGAQRAAVGRRSAVDVRRVVPHGLLALPHSPSIPLSACRPNASCPPVLPRLSLSLCLSLALSRSPRASLSLSRFPRAARPCHVINGDRHFSARLQADVQRTGRWLQAHRHRRL